LAEGISPKDYSFKYLHAAQLVKHILGLRHHVGNHQTFRLVYLWFDAPFDGGSEHRKEIEKFKMVAQQDGINFQSLTWQELILRLVDRSSIEHHNYIEYLVTRYL